MIQTEENLNMSIVHYFKQNRFIRGLYFLWRDYFGYSRRKFGFIAPDSFITPPIKITRPENCYLMGNNTLRDEVILNLNARFVLGKGSGATEGFKVATGNHAQLIGRFYRTITEAEKPGGYSTLLYRRWCSR